VKEKFGAVVIAVLVISMALAGCSPEEPDAEVSYSDIHKTSLFGGISTLNPYTLESRFSMFIANLIDGLVEADIYGRYVPSLAKRWETNEDATVWTFYIREGQYWVDHTGKKTQWEVAAEDFVDAMKYIADPNNAADDVGSVSHLIKGFEDYYNALAAIAAGEEVVKTREDILASFDETVGVKAIDRYTLQYTLSSITPHFLSLINSVQFLPVEREFLAQVGEDFGTSKETLLYCGGYYMSEWERDKRILLLENEEYWDKGNINLKTLSFELVPEGITGVELFQRGVVDSTSMSFDTYNNIKSTEWADYVYVSDKTTTTGCFTYNFASRNPEFSAAIQNLNFRKALYAAFDRATLASLSKPEDPELFCRNTLLPEDAMLDEDGLDYTEYPGLYDYKHGNPFDEAAAKEYMVAAISELCDDEGNIKGVNAGTKVDMLPITEFTVDGKLPIDIVFTNSNNNMEGSLLVKEMLTKYLGEKNVNVILGFSQTNFNSEVYAFSNWDMVTMNLLFRYGDPSSILNLLTTDSSGNDGQYVVPEFDALVAKANGTSKINERYAAFAEAEKWMLDNAMVVPYMAGGGTYQMTRIVPYTRQGGYPGLTSSKFKGALVQKTPVTKEQRAQLKAEYEAARKALARDQ